MFRSTPRKANLPVYIEKVDKATGWLLLDFPDYEYYLKFIESVGIDIVEGEKRSMIEIEGVVFQSKFAPREGSFYEFPETLLSNIDWNASYQRNSLDDNYSNVIAFRINFPVKVIVNFGKALPKQLIFGRYYFEREDEATELSIKELDQIQKGARNVNLIVRDVGQGNWNEIYFESGHVIMYDIGASVKYSSKQIKAGVIRKSKIKRLLTKNATLDKCVLIISHWDIDHYLGIFQVRKEYLAGLGKIIVMTDPVSHTGKEALRRIKEAITSSDRLLEIAPAPRGKAKGDASKLHRIYTKSGISLFKGSKSSSRNKSGLSLSIWTSNSLAILPADHHYEQIDEHILRRVPDNFKTYLVVPHHGGHAGACKLVHKIKKPKHAIVSVGDNKWKHPYAYVTRELEDKFGPKNVIYTKSGDYSEII